MGTVRESVDKFREFTSRGRSLTINNNRFNSALAPLGDEVDRGFNKNEIDVLVQALVSIPLTLPKFSSLIRVIIPESTVSKSAMEDMSLWAFMNYKTKQSCSILVLQWITVLLENELVERSSLDGFYELFCSMLRCNAVERDAAKLVYMLTNPEDVTRWRVNLVLRLHRANNGQRHTNALLQRFKSYRPELLPETVAAFSIVTAFKRTSALFADKMAAAARRVSAGKGGGQILWGEGEGLKRRGLGWIQREFVPPPLTLTLGSKKRRQHVETNTIQHFKTMESLACHQLTLSLPCQAMSLLGNQAGRHLLVFGDRLLQERFADTLLPKLIALLRRGSSDFGHTESVLGKLVSLQRLAQQGLSSVSKALANFLHAWNGDDFQREVWALLERSCFHSQHVFPEIVFPHVRRLFLQTDERGQSLIVRSMTRLTEFQYESCWRARQDLRTLFDAPPAPSADTLSMTSQFVGTLCVDGLINGTTHGTLLLDASLGYYHTVSLLEADSEMPVWTVMPPVVFYCALFGRNLHALRCVLQILIRYLTVDKQRLASLKSTANFKSETESVSRFAADTINCLSDAKAFSGRDAGLAFVHASETALLSLAKQDELDEVYAPKNNLAFAPFLDSTKDVKSQVNRLVPEIRQLTRLVSIHKGKSTPRRK